MFTKGQEDAVDRVREHLTSDKGEGEKLAAQIYVWMAGTKTYQDAQGRRVTKPTGEDSERLVEIAKVDPAAWDAACMLSTGLLENDEPLPVPLREFTTAMLRGADRPAKKGRPKYANLARDLYIAACIPILLNAGFSLSRNQATRDSRDYECPSASSIIAPMCGVDEGSVIKVWSKFQSHVEMTQKYGPYYFTEHGLRLDLFSIITVGK